MAQALPHPIMYTTAGQQVNQYAPQYYPTTLSASVSYAQFPFVDRHRPERRRPKYTRSKTGCLTCRRKKVKCDETKPMCQRCQNSQLDCSWPEVVPPKKKVQPRRKGTPINQETGAAPGTDVRTPPLPSIASQGQQSHESPQSVSLVNLPEQNLLQADFAGGNDRRRSEPHLHMSPPDSVVAGRRHTIPDIADTQFSQPYPDSISTNGAVNNAMGLTIRRFNNPIVSSAVRSSTPNDMMYTQQIVNHYSPYSPAGSIQMLPGVNSSAVSSRPSTANSIPPSHSLTRGTPSSRPSTANGITNLPTHQYVHRPESSNGGSEESILLGFTPGSFQLQGVRGREYEGVVPTDASPYMSAFSRPSTANSPASSPYIRHVAHLSESGAERWQPSPLARTSPLANAVQMQVADGYCPPSLHSTPQHSRPQSPWNC